MLGAECKKRSPSDKNVHGPRGLAGFMLASERRNCPAASAALHSSADKFFRAWNKTMLKPFAEIPHHIGNAHPKGTAQRDWPHMPPQGLTILSRRPFSLAAAGTLA